MRDYIVPIDSKPYEFDSDSLNMNSQVDSFDSRGKKSIRVQSAQIPALNGNERIRNPRQGWPPNAARKTII